MNKTKIKTFLLSNTGLINRLPLNNKHMYSGGHKCTLKADL